MPPLTAPELDRWERRFARSLEDLELLHASDGQLARRETKVRQARVRKQKKTRPCSTPKHSIGKRNDARAAYANDRAQLLEVLASDCGCALHAEGCYHALLERHGMSVLNDIVRCFFSCTAGAPFSARAGGREGGGRAARFSLP